MNTLFPLGARVECTHCQYKNHTVTVIANGEKCGKCGKPVYLQINHWAFFGQIATEFNRRKECLVKGEEDRG